ncbi:MAG: hypothetical protein H7240_11280 [Glaciimonas sp.]|nr:hypothetical protein [Glaciimonas sp.]
MNTNVGDKDVPNGLSTPALLFGLQHELALTYAGDVQGNLWKFDLSDKNSNNWSKYQLSSAKNGTNKTQPIVQQPLLAPSPMGGYLVTVGSGK